MPQKGQITRWYNHIIDWVRPKHVYVVRYGWFNETYFRTERAALNYIEKEEKSNPAIYNGAEDIRLIKRSFYGERTDNTP